MACLVYDKAGPIATFRTDQNIKVSYSTRALGTPPELELRTCITLETSGESIGGSVGRYVHK